MGLQLWPERLQVRQLFNETFWRACEITWPEYPQSIRLFALMTDHLYIVDSNNQLYVRVGTQPLQPIAFPGDSSNACVTCICMDEAFNLWAVLDGQ